MFGSRNRDPYLDDHEEDCGNVFDESGELVADLSELEWVNDDGEHMVCPACQHEHAIITSIIDQTGDVRFYFDAIAAFEAEAFFERYKPGPERVSPEMDELISIVQSERKKFEAYLNYEANQRPAGGQTS